MRPTPAQAKAIIRQVASMAGLGIVTGVVLPDGSRWGECRRQRTPAAQAALDEQWRLLKGSRWCGTPPFPRAAKSQDWCPRTRTWSWER